MDEVCSASLQLESLLVSPDAPRSDDAELRRDLFSSLCERERVLKERRAAQSSRERLSDPTCVREDHPLYTEVV